MPHIDGIGVLESLIENNINIPMTIMLSAVGQDLITSQAISLGASYYILKPFEIDALIKRIREFKSNPQKSQPQYPTNIKNPYIILDFRAVYPYNIINNCIRRRLL